MIVMLMLLLSFLLRLLLIRVLFVLVALAHILTIINIVRATTMSLFCSLLLRLSDHKIPGLRGRRAKRSPPV